ncbi:benzoyl-CoA reductase/2-hydroxyglutaryl-CoA dehydratase [Candidatus Scalindua japonica]|uniref:Benzoyl-CoA reductase/2-hydroxyglutaryl-CoA dehydratase n=1 Tax=Candidatus Scalindua japonica TaxID=1284222 RepID=A0A286TT99_9BACT|nr:2-hydroxyacyl-CoA dehydratase family protein [Candidatus Scalindua japonica]GAX59139.1 benzoyl-CoA reductase/2-hydroxyglutaryl-CoA dehydratase [Candidatus Scalindua japonica]
MIAKISKKSILDILSMMNKYPDVFIKGNAMRYLFIEFEKELIRIIHDRESYVLVNEMIPSQIVNAFDIPHIVDEQFVVFNSAFADIQKFINITRQSFSFKDNCSYYNVLTGMLHSGAIPYPTYSLTASLFCDWCAKTVELLSRRKRIKHSLVDIPSDNDSESLQYTAEQLEKATIEMCEIFNIRYDKNIVEQAYYLSKQAKELDRTLDNLINSAPPVIRGIELYNFKMLCYHFLGTEIAVKAMKLFIEGVRDKINNGDFLYGEKHYIVSAWFHIPPLHSNKLLVQIEKKHQLYLRYCMLADWDWIAPEDDSNVYISLAKQIFKSPNHGTTADILEKFEKKVNQYNIKAILNFQHKNCIPFAGYTKILSNYFTRKGIHVLEINGDAVDIKAMNEGQLLTRIEAFGESLALEYEGINT